MYKSPIIINMVQENDGWVGQCLQYDIAAQSETMEGAFDECVLAIISELAVCEEIGKDILSIPPAPNWYWINSDGRALSPVFFHLHIKRKPNGKPGTFTYTQLNSPA